MNAAKIDSHEFTIIYAKSGNIVIQAGDIHFQGFVYEPNGNVIMSASNIQVNERIKAPNADIAAGKFQFRLWRGFISLREHLLKNVRRKEMTVDIHKNFMDTNLYLFIYPYIIERYYSKERHCMFESMSVKETATK